MIYETETILNTYTSIYSNRWKHEDSRLRTSIWLGKTFWKSYKAKPYKKLRNTFRWCFCGSYNNTLLGFLRNLSDFPCKLHVFKPPADYRSIKFVLWKWKCPAFYLIAYNLQKLITKISILSDPWKYNIFWNI